MLRLHLYKAAIIWLIQYQRTNLLLQNHTTTLPTTIFQWRDVIMSTMAPQLTGVSIVYSTICFGAHQIKHQSTASLAFMKGIHRWPVNSPHKGPVTRKLFPFDDVIMNRVPSSTDFWMLCLCRHNVLCKVSCLSACWSENISNRREHVDKAHKFDMLLVLHER